LPALNAARAVAPSGVVFGEGVSSSSMRGGLGRELFPIPQKILVIFELKMLRFGAF